MKNKFMIFLILFSIFLLINSVLASSSGPPMPYDDVGGTMLGILIMLGFGFFCCMSGNN